MSVTVAELRKAVESIDRIKQRFNENKINKQLEFTALEQIQKPTITAIKEVEKALIDQANIDADKIKREQEIKDEKKFEEEKRLLTKRNAFIDKAARVMNTKFNNSKKLKAVVLKLKANGDFPTLAALIQSGYKPYFNNNKLKAAKPNEIINYLINYVTNGPSIKNDVDVYKHLNTPAVKEYAALVDKYVIENAQFADEFMSNINDAPKDFDTRELLDIAKSKTPSAQSIVSIPQSNVSSGHFDDYYLKENLPKSDAKDWEKYENIISKLERDRDNKSPTELADINDKISIYKKEINKLREKAKSLSGEVSGSGMRYNHPKELIIELSKLIASHKAGNKSTKLYNDANNIMKELLKPKVITKEQYVELVNLF